MIKLFSLIFNLCYLPLLQARTRGAGYASTSLYQPNHQLRYNSKIKNYYELMSHLLYLNSCDNYPNKCPHICLHLIVKQHSMPPGHEKPARTCLIREAYYTDRHHHGNHKFQSARTLLQRARPRIQCTPVPRLTYLKQVEFFLAKLDEIEATEERFGR